MKYASLLFFSLFCWSFAFAAQLPPGFVEEQIAQGLDPTTMAITPDGRVLIAEKNGRISVVENGELLPGSFLEIEVDNFNERGLSGLVLDPNFELNNHYYVFYTVPGGNYNRISRFTANGNYTLPDSEDVLMELAPLSGTIHNGGAMCFGPDGKLYIAVGDGADPENGQDLNTTLGKILRINPDGSIPQDNPFYNELSGQARAIYAYGFRNPFTMAVDPTDGRLYANDVGSSLFEEVNAIVAGGNYGWALQEGYGTPPFPTDYQAPLHAYSHDVGCSVIGAAFYRPQQLQFPPEYLGRYFFADYCEGIIWTLAPGSAAPPEVFATDIQRPIAMATAPDGSLYYLERRGLGGGSPTDNTSSSNGVLWKVSYTGSGVPFVSNQPRSVLLAIGESTTFSCAASGAAPLSYQWERDGELLSAATSSTLTVDDVSLADDGAQFRCRISNDQGSVWTETATLSVTSNSRPVPTLLLPVPGTTYRAGDELSFAGEATDAEDGALANSQLVWRIDFHHDNHTHPGMAPTAGIAEGSFQIPTIGETSDNVWFRVHLTATDSEGLSQSVYRDVFPEKRELQLRTQPSGLQLRLDGRNLNTPYEGMGVVGVIRSLRAPATQVRNDSLYAFIGWAEGYEEALISFAMPDSNTRFTALYEPVPIGEGSGLTGAYYDEVEHNFEGEADFWRIDTTVAFVWDGGSPSEDLIGNDFFNIRWSGMVEPQFSENYTFHIVSDDGVRLWVDGELIIDQWVPQPPTETTASIELQAGQRYPIRLEYFEDAGGAECTLYWSSERIPRAVIPKTQLYPGAVNSLSGEDWIEELQLYPQPARETLNVLVVNERPLRLQVRLSNAAGQLVWKGIWQHQSALSLHQLDTNNLPAGMYQLQLETFFGRLSRQVLVK